MRLKITIFVLFIPFLLKANEQLKPSWIDLPSSTYLCHMDFSPPVKEKLSLDLDLYHSKDKCSIESIQERVDCLALILHDIDRWSEVELNPSDFAGFTLLKKIVCSKKAYLSQIQEIYENDHNQELEKYHRDISSAIHPDHPALILRNERIYSLKMQGFWGDFWWESLDPCHRRLSSYLELWEKLCEQNPTTPPFFLWLENQHVPNSFPQVTYLEEEELPPYHFIISDGLIRHSVTSIPLDCEPYTRNIYVISLDEKLYISPPIEGIWHSSFSKGKPVLAAGVISVENGILRVLSIESGHYFPSFENGYQSITLLLKMGICFDETFQICFYENKKKYSVDVSSADLAGYPLFHRALTDETRRVLLSTCEF